MTLLLESLLTVSVVLALALVAMPLLRSRSAALRHCVIGVALACAAAAPVVGPLAPAARVADPIVLPVPLREPVDEPVPARRVEAASSGARPAPVAAPAASWRLPRLSVSQWIVIAWAIGAGAGVALLLTGLLRLAIMIRRARPVTRGRLVSHLAAVQREYGLTRAVTLLQIDNPGLVLTCGAFRPKVIVPQAADHWSDQRVALVLRHELAHVARHDWLWQIGAGVLRAVYWFNPLVWIAGARLRRESEQACDDMVMARGVAGADYAEHLVDIAREVRHRRTWLPAPAIAHTSGFERRVKAMLDARVNRRPLSRAASAAIVLAWLALSVPLAAWAAQSVVRLNGTVVDPTGGQMPGVALTLTNTRSNAVVEAQSDRQGHYEFPALAPGSYVVTASIPGFRDYRASVTIGGADVLHDIRLDVGTLQETVTIKGGGESLGPRPLDAAARGKLEEQLARRRAQRCEAPTRTGAFMGGNIRPPMKIKHVTPVFPASQSGATGVVALKAKIGPEGDVVQTEVVSSTHADFTHATVEAVRQWLFDSTLLNCEAIPVDMTVTARFVQ